MQANLQNQERFRKIIISLVGLTKQLYEQGYQRDDIEMIEINGQTILIEQTNFTGTNGNDNITGTSGDDYFTNDAGNDTINGGSGNDRYDANYSNASSGLTMTYDTTTGSGTITVDTETDIFTSITNALTVNYTVEGTAVFNIDYAQSGAASFTSTTGIVNFAANSATATVTINPTADTTVESDETVALTLAAGTDYTIGTKPAVTGTIINEDFSRLSINDITVVPNKNSFANNTIDNIIRDTGNDRLIGNSLNNTLAGSGSNDQLISQDRNDSLIGETGDDLLTGVTGGNGSDNFIFSSNSVFNNSNLGIDAIAYFSQDSDKIVLSKATFAALQSIIGNGFSQPAEFASVADLDYHRL